MRVISLTNASSIPHPQPGEPPIPAGEDGVFDLPHEFAMHLTTKHASQWRTESEHEAAAAAAKLDELRNPNIVPGVLAKLMERADAAEARLDALEAGGSKPQASAPRAAKKTAAKRTAVKKTAEAEPQAGDDSDGSGDPTEDAPAE